MADHDLGAHYPRQTSGRGGGASYEYPPPGSYGVGDRIQFKATCRWPTRVEVRTVNGFTNDDRHWPTVRCYGYAEFVVRPSEVICVMREAGR
jgi:hypothetical protein